MEKKLCDKCEQEIKNDSDVVYIKESIPWYELRPMKIQYRRIAICRACYKNTGLPTVKKEWQVWILYNSKSFDEFRKKIF